MSAALDEVAVPHMRPARFRLEAETPKLLAELGARARPKLSASQMLQCLVTFAFDAIVLGRPTGHPFAVRVRELAQQQEHPRASADTSFTLDIGPGGHLDAIRRLQVGLRLPRQGLVVDYVAQAAWEMRPPDGDGGSGEKKEDPLDRSRRLASEHNVDGLRSAPLLTLVPPSPEPPPQLSLFEEVIAKS